VPLNEHILGVSIFLSFFYNIPLSAEFEFEFPFLLYVCIDDDTVSMSWVEFICTRGGRDGSLGVTWSSCISILFFFPF